MKALKDASISQNWESFISYIDRRLQGIQTGIIPIDKYLLGLGGFTTIQGETGTNKSTLALQIVYHNLLQGNPCLMIDKENGEGRVRSRLMCQAHNISETDLKVSTRDERLAWVAPIRKLPLFIYTESIKETDVIKQRLEQSFEASGGKPQLLLVDSLQALNPLDGDQRISLEKWIYFFDELKVQWDGKLTILLTSEKNRASYGNSEVGAAKGTNAVEYKSETLFDMRHGENGSLILKVIKNRDGLRGGEFELTKLLSEPHNPNSFCFKLGVLEVEEI